MPHEVTAVAAPLLAAVIGVALPMCNRAPPSRDSAATTVTAKTKTTTNAARQDNAVITLERTPCFGQCPVYRVTLKGDGTVVFEGKANVDSTGRRVGRVSSDNVKTLVRFADAIGYFSFADSYATGQGCAPYIADMPHAITSIALTARMKRVDADHGCAAVPRRLSELEAKIDQTSESWRWIGRR